MNVKDNRSFWFYLLLTFLTCGLYSIYFWYVYVEDLNTIFYGDGEDSPNYIIVLLLSWVLWTLLGYLTGGIGQLVADYFMIQNLNKTALVYNSRAY